VDRKNFGPPAHTLAVTTATTPSFQIAGQDGVEPRQTITRFMRGSDPNTQCRKDAADSDRARVTREMLLHCRIIRIRDHPLHDRSAHDQKPRPFHTGTHKAGRGITCRRTGVGLGCSHPDAPHRESTVRSPASRALQSRSDYLQRPGQPPRAPRPKASASRSQSNCMTEAATAAAWQSCSFRRDAKQIRWRLQHFPWCQTVTKRSILREAIRIPLIRTPL